ncbi:small nuclear ribonucleoprotein 35kDa (U11 U12) [Phytophthora pseudosyringae]|uniref:Small nuclear ribonucleoprotein 35kDa (U11 U12) n=1 Tax=Phytophthora pseudosyringae TaxID=221518 RepID=A0A8T1W9G9_9STRA|nr:small nuclear ribonucleoprotein 35kDa (U11 U12) [Phytophthora pseudosyringae]
MARERVGDKRRRSRSRSRSRDRVKRADTGGRSARPGWFAEEYDPVQIGSIDGTDTTPHDKGLVRALSARFDASTDPQIQGDPYSTLFVARLSFATTEETLRHLFNDYGPLRRLRLVRDQKTDKSKGYAFVEFEHERHLERAYRAAHRRVVDGATILVDFERSRVMKGWKPRRLGGGLGGKKESGQLRFGGRDRPFKPPLVPR